MIQGSSTVLPMKKSLLRKTIRQQATTLVRNDSASVATASEVVCEKISEWLSKKMEKHHKRESIPFCTSPSPIVSSAQHAVKMTGWNPAPHGSSPRFLSSSFPSLCIGAYWAFSSEVSLEPLLHKIWSWRATGWERNGEERGRNTKVEKEVSCSENETKQEEAHLQEDRRCESPRSGMKKTISSSHPKATTRTRTETKEVAVLLPVVLTKDMHHYLHQALRWRPDEKERGKMTTQKEREEDGVLLSTSSSSMVCSDGPVMILLEVFDRADFDYCFSDLGGGDCGFRCRSVPKEKLKEIFFSDRVAFITRHPRSAQEDGWKGGTEERTRCPISEVAKSEKCTGTGVFSLSDPVDHQGESASNALRRVWLCDDWDVLFPGCAVPTPAFVTDSFTLHPVELVLLTPGLGFTRDGDRLGKGGGFYDRFIKFYRQNSRESHLLGSSTIPHFVSGATPLVLEFQTVGVGFDFQLVDAGTIFMEEHDEVMSAVVTPSFSSLP